MDRTKGRPHAGGSHWPIRPRLTVLSDWRIPPKGYFMAIRDATAGPCESIRPASAIHEAAGDAAVQRNLEKRSYTGERAACCAAWFAPSPNRGVVAVGNSWGPATYAMRGPSNTVWNPVLAPPAMASLASQAIEHAMLAECIAADRYRCASARRGGAPPIGRSPAAMAPHGRGGQALGAQGHTPSSDSGGSASGPMRMDAQPPQPRAGSAGRPRASAERSWQRNPPSPPLM